MQDLGSVLRGLANAKALFNRPSGSEDTNTYLPELVSLRSPFEVPRAAVALFNLGLKGPTTDLRGSDPWWGRGPRTWCQRLIELWTTWQFSPYGIVDWPRASSRRDDRIGARNTGSDVPTSQGERTPRLRMGIPSSSCLSGAFFPFPLSTFFPSSSLRSLLLFILLHRSSSSYTC